MSMQGATSIKHNRQPLALTKILSSALPTSLGLPNSPDRYMVPAVFSRAPSARETAVIEGHATAARLRAARYDTVELKVSDRRLEIRGTNLSELQSGLATTIARILADATTAEDGEDAERFAAATAKAKSEATRARAVAEEAAAIRFDIAGPERLDREVR